LAGNKHEHGNNGREAHMHLDLLPRLYPGRC